MHLHRGAAPPVGARLGHQQGADQRIDQHVERDDAARVAGLGLLQELAPPLGDLGAVPRDHRLEDRALGLEIVMELPDIHAGAAGDGPGGRAAIADPPEEFLGDVENAFRQVGTARLLALRRRRFRLC